MIPVRSEMFENAYAKCCNILTAINIHEAALLHEYALKCPEKTNILEVGARFGFSTILLAQCGLIVNTVDPLIPGLYKDDCNDYSCEIHTEDAIKLAENIKPYSNINWIRKKREDVEKTDIKPPIGFMFIDSDHNYPHPKNDFLHFIDDFVPGSYQAFHDYGLFKGVTKSILELEEEGIIESVTSFDTMMITRLKNA